MTGRPRRCGWFDAVAVRHSARVSGSTEVAVMLLDVLSGLETLQVAVAYEDEQGRSGSPTSRATWPTWSDAGRSTRPLPGLVRGHHRRPGPGTSCRPPPGDYVDFLERQVGVPVSIVSVGPERTQTIPRPRRR